MKKTLSDIISIVLGVVFLLSGYGKLHGIDAFETLIESYGFPHLAFLAPAIVIIELLLGILLVLRFRTKMLGWVSCSILLVFTGLYSYAFVVHGITDCGCFGNNPVLQSNPTISYIRNIIMIIMSVALIIWGDNEKNTLSKPIIIVISIILIVCAFITGTTYRVPSMFVKQHPLFMKNVSETKIPEYVDISKDSTYAIYVFSYDCPECWNNMTNFMNYATDSVADRLIGLCVGGKGRKTFMEYFKPNFRIYEVNEDFSENVNVVPTFLYVKDAMIYDIIQGEVLNPKLFRNNYLENNN